MKYRVIVRVSYTADTGSAVRNALLPLMNAAGLSNTATGTWESEATELHAATTCLSGMLSELANLDDPTGRHLKHVWIYIDRPRPDDDNELAEALLGSEEEE